LAFGAKRKTILIVEDNEEMQTIYASLFEVRADKYEVEILGEAVRAFKRLKEKPFDLVILDMIMEPMDGEEFFSCVRNDTEILNMPILVVSVLGPDDLEHLKKLGHVNFLQKPITADQLFEKIDQLIEK